MMKKYCYLLSLLCILFSARAAIAGLSAEAGTRGAAFLRIGPSARASAFGGAFTAVTGDAASIDYNPAGIATMKSPQLSATYSNWFAATRYGNTSFAMPAGKNAAAGLSYTYLDYGTLTRVSGQNDYGVPIEEGDFTASDMNVSLAYARRFPGFRKSPSFGAVLKATRLAIDAHNAYGFGIDAGFILPFDRSTTFGGTIRNMGSVGSMTSSDDQMPQEYTLGVAHRVDLFDGDCLLLTADGIVPADAAIHYLFGIEYTLFDTVFLRAGYRGNYDTDKFTLGTGILHKDIRLDYAYAPYSFLGDTHRISLSYCFPIKSPKNVRKKPADADVDISSAAPAGEASPQPRISTSSAVAVVVPSKLPAAPKPLQVTDDPVKRIHDEARSIRFAEGSALIRQADEAALARIGRYILDCKPKRVRIEVHADSSAGKLFGEQLAAAQAITIKYFLVRKGVPAALLEPVGIGENTPAENDAPASRPATRRIEFVIIR